MKKIFMMWVLLGILFTCSSTAVFSSEDISGTIIDILGQGNATIQVDVGHNLKVGNKIDLTYMAGVLPMMIGVYEITTVQGSVVLCKPVSTTMPADKGMNVQIDVLKSNSAKETQGQSIMLLGQEASFDQFNPAGMEPPSRDPRFNDLEPENYNIDFGTQEVSDVKIGGEVIEVMGTDVRIKLISPGDLRVGFIAELTHRISSGVDIPVGTWKVININQREVVATTDDENAIPRVGLKALVYMKEESISVQKQLFSEVAVGEDGFPKKKRIFENKSPQRSDSIPSLRNPSLSSTAIFDKKEEEKVILQQEIGKGVKPAGKARKYWLGVEIKNSLDVSKQKYADFPFGVIVVAVRPNSVAQRGGLQKGDMIHRVNGTGVNNTEHFISLINRSDGKVKLKLQRDGKKVKKTITFDRME